VVDVGELGLHLLQLVSNLSDWIRDGRMPSGVGHEVKQRIGDVGRCVPFFKEDRGIRDSGRRGRLGHEGLEDVRKV